MISLHRKTTTILAALAACGTVAFAQDSTDLNAIWNDPVFKKQFIAGYGINSEIEPRVTPDEVKILEKIRPLMSTDLPKAAATLQKQMKADCSARLDFDLGSIYYQQEQMDQALECYRKAVGKFPSFRRAWRSLGLIHMRNGKPDDAIAAFTRMIELGGGDAYSYGLLGYAYAGKQDYQAAEAAFRNALLLQPDNTQWRLGLTQCVFKQQKFEDAATLLDGLLERYPDKAEFWTLQAHTFIGMKQPLKAAANFEALDLMGKSTAEGMQNLGDIYVSENLPDLAIRAYMRAIDIDPKQPASRSLHAAEVLVARGSTSQAKQLAEHIRETWEKTMEDTDRQRLLKLEVRVTMAEGTGDSNAVGILEDIVKLNPLDGEALLMLGQHYSRTGEPDRAMFYYERAESIDAYEVNAKVRHAQVLVGIGRYADALPLLRRAQELKPRDDVARYLEQVERLAKSKR